MVLFWRLLKKNWLQEAWKGENRQKTSKTDGKKTKTGKQDAVLLILVVFKAPECFK